MLRRLVCVRYTGRKTHVDVDIVLHVATKYRQPQEDSLAPLIYYIPGKQKQKQLLMPMSSIFAWCSIIYHTYTKLNQLKFNCVAAAIQVLTLAYKYS